MLNSLATTTYSRRAERIDVDAIKQAHPIREVVTGYGIELRRQGRADVGRCPFHADGGRPNLCVWADTSSWWCFRCNFGGDAIRFVELESVSFREALERLGGAGLRELALRRAAPPPPPPSRGFEDHDSGELAALQAATAVYHHRLLADPLALAYLAERGLHRAAVLRHRIGYAAGDELIPYLRWRRLPLDPALRLGLLNHSGREFLAGRIVVPELRHGQPVWLVGRILNNDAIGEGDAEEAPPKYLALRGSKPLLGAELARDSATIVVVEGVFDLLTLRTWGYPAVALVGTHTRPDVIDELRAFKRVYLVLDQDDAGIEARLKLLDAIGPGAVPVALPEGTKDVAELAPRADGQALFAAALLEAVGVPRPEAPSQEGAQQTTEALS